AGPRPPGREAGSRSLPTSVPGDRHLDLHQGAGRGIAHRHAALQFVDPATKVAQAVAVDAVDIDATDAVVADAAHQPAVLEFDGDCEPVGLRVAQDVGHEFAMHGAQVLADTVIHSQAVDP